MIWIFLSSCSQDGIRPCTIIPYSIRWVTVRKMLFKRSCIIAAFVFDHSTYQVVDCSYKSSMDALYKQSSILSKLNWCLFASNLYNNGVKVVHICSICIDSLHREDKLVVVVLKNDCHFFHNIEWQNVGYFFCVLLECNFSGYKVLVPNSLRNPWTSKEYRSNRDPPWWNPHWTDEGDQGKVLVVIPRFHSWILLIFQYIQ